MVFAYRRAGLLPEEQEVSYPLTEPLEEMQPFLPQEPSLILRSLLSNRLTATLAYGLDLVAEEGLILRPEYVYELLSTVLKKGSGYNVACRANALKVSGNRGKWLLPLLEVEEESPLDLEHWELSGQQARLQLLKQVRREDPRAAIPLVERTWREETASNREALLSCFSIGLSQEDEEFLTAVMAKDRSQKVREVARRFSGRLPKGSSSDATASS